jgi:hypothetical protein
MVRGTVEYQYLIDNDMTIIKKSGFEQMLKQIDAIELENKQLKNDLIRYKNALNNIYSRDVFVTEKEKVLKCGSYAWLAADVLFYGGGGDFKGEK